MTTKTSPTELTVTWQYCPFNELTAGELYAVMEVRQRVFVVEQNCAYLDADGTDHLAHHLLGWRNTPEGLLLAAYARIFPPGVKFAEASIGRVLTHPSARGGGLGRALMAEAIQRVADADWGKPIRLAAQMYLEAFYEEFDFRRVTDPYLEDDIWHVDMLRD
jgi:ElaA protein